MNITRTLIGAAIIAIAITPSCKRDKPECDTAMRDTLEVRELRLKEREMALREREMAVMEREQQLGIAKNADSYTAHMASSNGGMSAGTESRAGVTGGRKDYSQKNTQVAYKKPVLDFPGQFPESSERILTEDDMEHKSAFGKKVMLNEIYARHGYIFPEKDLIKHFAGESWYKGNEKSLGKIKLTPTEVQNIAFIKKHQ